MNRFCRSILVLSFIGVVGMTILFCYVSNTSAAKKNDFVLRNDSHAMASFVEKNAAYNCATRKGRENFRHVPKYYTRPPARQTCLTYLYLRCYGFHLPQQASKQACQTFLAFSN